MAGSIEEYMKEHYPDNEWYYDLLSNEKEKIVVIPSLSSNYKIYFDSHENEKGEISWSAKDSNGFS